MFNLFGGSSRRKSTVGTRVRKLASKVAKLEKKAAMKATEQKLKQKLAKLKGI